MSGYKESIQKVINHIKIHGPDHTSLNDLLTLCDYQLKENPGDRDYCFKYSGYIKECAMNLHIQTKDEKYGDLYWKAMLFEAQNKVVDSYLIYLEKNRDPEDRFYMPRRKKLIQHGFIQGLQDLIDDKIDILSISAPPGSGKTGLGELFISGFMGWFWHHLYRI